MPGLLSNSSPRLVIISGVSGSGKSTALNALEDIGFNCVDNLPAALLGHFATFIKERVVGVPGAVAALGQKHFALLVNFREGESFNLIRPTLRELSESGTEVKLLYFDAQDDAVLRRFQETRRPHPLLMGETTLHSIAEALARERELLGGFREAADRIFDTTSFSPHDLRRHLEDYFAHERELEVTVLSFGFKYGMPHDADSVIDVRFLPNPHFIAELRPKTGLEAEVASYVIEGEDATQFLDKYVSLLRFLIPRYEKEGKRYFTVAVGCTGGRHRSVALSEKIGKQLQEEGFDVTVRHRDIERPH